jgi:hypothetical protein
MPALALIEIDNRCAEVIRCPAIMPKTALPVSELTVVCSLHVVVR